MCTNGQILKLISFIFTTIYKIASLVTNFAIGNYQQMKKYDIVIFGATGFVGQIIYKYLQQNYADLKLAIAGRNHAKLKQIAATFNSDCIVADANDPVALKKLAQSTKLVISTVGPYAVYGANMVAACATQGTDYCDLTGEVHFVEKMINRHWQQAAQSGARIIHCCGFDSVPSDIGVFYLQQLARQKYALPCTSVHNRVVYAKGGASGGTVASIINLLRQASGDAKLRHKLNNPYLLASAGQLAPNSASVKQRQHKTANYDAHCQQWTAPFIMEVINSRIVHRSNALQNYPYGKCFRYDEAVLTGKSAAGRFRALALTAAIYSFAVAAVVPPTRWLMEQTFLPKSGSGPSEAQQQNGGFKYRMRGFTENNQQQLLEISATGDPGYSATAKMIAQAALCLLKDYPRDQLGGGFWTPASAMGAKYLARLEKYAAFSFKDLSAK